MLLANTLAGLAALSGGLNFWQWLAAQSFPVNERIQDKGFAPAVTLFKPLKGCDAETEGCLRSWFEQEYGGPVQILFGVASPEDPVCPIVRELLAAYPKIDADLVICRRQLGPNAKVSTLVQLEPRAKHELWIISDADVHAPRDLISNLAPAFRDEKLGLVNCLYQLSNASNAAMAWEAIAINADFWSQVLQARSLKPLDFALGAVMATTQTWVRQIGGFSTLLDHLADDYQLGHKIAAQGGRIELSPLVVECLSSPMSWFQVWRHQLRWTRTIRVCQPGPFFFSILSNATVWPLFWLAAHPESSCAAVVTFLLICRILTARSNQHRLTGDAGDWGQAWLILAKDLLGLVIWALAFTGNEVEWRGERFRMLRDGRLRPK